MQGFSQVQYIGVVSDSCEDYNSVYTIEHVYNGTPASGTTYFIYQDGNLIGQGGGGLGCCHVEDLRPLTDTVIFAAINEQGLIHYTRTLDGGAHWTLFDFAGALTYKASRFYSENTGYVMRYYWNNELHIKRISDIKPREIIYPTTLDTANPHIYIKDTLYGSPYCPDINEVVYQFIKDSTDIFVHIVFDVIISDISKIEDKIDINVFPNPSNSLITINIASDCTIEIIDMFGKVVLRQNLLKGLTKLNIEDFSPGYYFIKFKTEHGVINRTLIKL